MEHQFQALVECSADAIFLTDFDSARFVHVNSRACALFGYDASELRGMTGRQLHPPEDWSLVDDISRDLVRDGYVERSAVRLQRKDGSVFWAELRSSTYLADHRKLYVSFVRDISARLDSEKELQTVQQTLKNLEAQLIRSSRLAAIGQIAAGVAHEVNNPAASALMNLQVFEREVQALAELVSECKQGADVRRMVEAMQPVIADAQAAARDSIEALERIASIVRGLSRFARIDHEDIRRVNVNDAVRAALRLVQHQLRHVVTVRCELASARELSADKGKLVQVFVNLLANACHAIEQGGGTSITVRTFDTDSGVIARVEDDGPGVPAEIENHIFEPFFTTKEAERGTGLGLSVCADIVHQHRGRLELRHDVNKGACFEVFLPTHTGFTVPPERSRAVSDLRGRILIVDDDVTLLRAYRRWLGRKHDVVVVQDVGQAMQVLERDANFDVILCDLMMPKHDGVALHEAVTTWKPELLERMVFCSGGPTTRRCQEFIGRPGIVFFEKPIRQELLDQYISRLVHRRTQSEQ